MQNKFYSQEIEDNFLINMMLDGEFYNLPSPVTEEHFFNIDNKKIFKAIQSICDKGQEVTPLAVHELSGVNQDIIMKIVNGYTPCKTDQSYAYLEEYRQKRRVQELSTGVLNDFVDMRGSDVADRIQKLSNELTDSLSATVEVDVISERFRKHMIAMAEDQIKPYFTGIKSFDDAIGGLFTSEFHVLAGFPSVGKSALALQLARNIAKSGKGTRYFSLEEDERAFFNRIISAEARFPFCAYRNGLNTEQRRQQNDLYNKVWGEGGTLSGTNFEIDNENDTLESIYLACAKHKKRYGLDFVVVDGATNINHKSSNIYERNEDIAQSLLRMARKLDITVLLLAHMNNNSQTKEGGVKKAPDQSGIMGGACLVKPAFSLTILESDGDVVLGQPSPIAGHLVKSRNTPRDQIMKLEFDGTYMTYSSRDF